MYTSSGFTKAILKAVYEGERNALIEQIQDADVEVLADEIFNIVGTLIWSVPKDTRIELERRLFSEATNYDFEAISNGFQGRFVFLETERPKGV